MEPPWETKMLTRSSVSQFCRILSSTSEVFPWHPRPFPEGCLRIVVCQKCAKFSQILALWEFCCACALCHLTRVCEAALPWRLLMVSRWDFDSVLQVEYCTWSVRDAENWRKCWELRLRVSLPPRWLEARLWQWYSFALIWVRCWSPFCSSSVASSTSAWCVRCGQWNRLFCDCPMKKTWPPCLPRSKTFCSTQNRNKTTLFTSPLKLFTAAWLLYLKNCFRMRTRVIFILLRILFWCVIHSPYNISHSVLNFWFFFKFLSFLVWSKPQLSECTFGRFSLCTISSRRFLVLLNRFVSVPVSESWADKLWFSLLSLVNRFDWWLMECSHSWQNIHLESLCVRQVGGGF